MLVLSITTLVLVALAAADTYDMVKEYAGSTFFDDWQFYDHFDNLTNGNAMFVSSKQARKSHLAYVDDTTGHAIMRVDNTSKLEFGDNRNTIRIQSVDQYTVGSVWTIDMFHVPYGCSVWPAFWSHSPNWPIGGEIDTFEAINLNPRSQMGLHTTPGCKQVSQNQSSTLVNSTDCSYLANNNEGCITTIPMDESYGEKFSSSGGGVWVTEFAQNGISVWFFPRSQVPSTLSSNASTIDTSTFGIPVGNWPSTGCDMGTYFGPQNLLFTITLCGDFAGSPSIFQQSCTGFCYQDYVLGNGSNYGTAYFEVGNVRVFSKTGTNTVIKGNGAMRNGLDLTMGLGALLGIMGMVWL